jgi:hypothetical protein
MFQIATEEVLRQEEPPVGVKKKRGLPQHQLENI